MPHITLLYPFRPRTGWGALLEQIEEACRRLTPFRVKLSGLRTFRHRESYTIWLAPEPKDALVALQTALWQVVPDCDDTGRYRTGFTPHLSVGQTEGHERTQAIVSDLQSEWAPIQFKASQIQLIWRNEPPDDVFRIGHRIRLGASSRVQRGDSQ
jgi:2'-5' RNA ligase